MLHLNRAYRKSITHVILTNNLLEYGDNYFMRSGSLWNNYRDDKILLQMKIILLIIG